MSEGVVGFVLAEGTEVDPLGEEGPVDGRDGVTDGVTFSGSAAEDGGGMLKPTRGVQCHCERHVG